MRLKTAYIVLCFFGLLLPYSQFIPWLMEHGLNINLFLKQLFSNRISVFFAADVFVSAVVLIVFIFGEHSHAGMRRRWLPIIALFTVGVSLAFPLFLYLRELEPDGRH
ncbi:MAG: DUF2834 domain-containing protein [Deltaproteobacteria bacterium]|nr:DUF2834 domain-containing protein [Deltaproteobacteria bacterium]MBV8453764.1 DUF2834 domain-containing protein [Deltaproteobacteria bacterium]